MEKVYPMILTKARLRLLKNYSVEVSVDDSDVIIRVPLVPNAARSLVSDLRTAE